MIAVKKCKALKMNWSNYIFLVHLLMYFISCVLWVEIRKDCNIIDGTSLLYNSPHNRNNVNNVDSDLLLQTGLPHNTWIQLCGFTCSSLPLLFKVSIPIIQAINSTATMKAINSRDCSCSWKSYVVLAFSNEVLFVHIVLLLFLRSFFQEDY